MLTLLSALSRHSCRLGRGPCPSTHTSATPTRGEGTRSGSGGGGAVAGLAARGKWQAPPLPSPRRGASPRAARLLTGEAERTRSPRPSPPAARRRQPRQAARSPLGQHKRGRGCRAHSRCPRARRVKRPRFSGPAIWRGPAQPSVTTGESRPTRRCGGSSTREATARTAARLSRDTERRRARLLLTAVVEALLTASQ
jgi:hypothetical protein